ncbi:MAG: stage III sporulation protein AE [Bacillota bacterium]|nr:stage III sporulation protein AE [Bacillota bacterium]
MKKGILLLVLLLSLLPAPVHGAEAVLQEMDRLETEAVDRAAAELEAETDFTALLKEILTGAFDFSFSDWREALAEAAFGELRLQGRLLLQLVIVVLLSAVLRQLSDSFQGRSVGEMGFYLCYMVLIVVILDTFRGISAVVVERMRGLNGVFTAMVPIFLTLLAAKGEVTRSALMGSAVMGGSAALSMAVEKILVHSILLAVSLEMADHISEKPILGRFAKLLRQCIGWGMKGAAMAFMLLLSLQRLGGGALNALAEKTAKIAVGSVPVVGDVMGGAVDMAAAVAGTLSSGALVAAAVFLLLLCLPLLIKLAVILLVFRLTAAAAEFICEERLVECISAAGEYTGLLMGVVFLGEGMFLFSALLLLGGL